MKYSVVELLAEDSGRWDKRIAADLASEIESQLGENASTIPEMRRLLAVKGYRELRLRIELDTAGRDGEDGIRAMAIAMRAFAHERPGLAAATFRSPAADSDAWRREGDLLGATALNVFRRNGLAEEASITALRILRALVRGFVLHEMSASFLEGVDYDKTYAAAISVFLKGLDALRPLSAPSRL
jgi:Tetracyclin repressor-like, C-terminal domain